MSEPKRFPILYQGERVPVGAPWSVPWEAVEPARKQALANHDQTLERLAERGGLSPVELVAALDGHKFSWVMRAVKDPAVAAECLRRVKVLGGEVEPKDR